ncbi:hypothetical protein, partial [Neobacillus drentensis]|uniref:hypothetical protein n=1 Tax=Neobacillus drentensis TaxID=220684 RepID=UPI002FFDB12E
TERKCNITENFSIKRVEINSAWAREAIGNLERDLKLNQLDEIKITQHIKISYNENKNAVCEANKNTVWEAKKIA